MVEQINTREINKTEDNMINVYTHDYDGEIRQVGDHIDDYFESDAPLAVARRELIANVAKQYPVAASDSLDALVEEATMKAEIDKNVSGSDSFIRVTSLKKYISDGLLLPQPNELIKHIVVEEETTILLGDTGLGKTAFALQMAIALAREGKKVLYVNFELSERQLAKRLQNVDIPENLKHAEIEYEKMHDVADQSAILAEIEKIALEEGIDVLIIDNLTNLCINSKDGAEAGNLMLRLISLRKVHKWTMVVLAHVPKRKLSDPLTINDLAGSKLIANFADNVIGLNASKKGKDKRYVIQLKYRTFGIELDCHNVQELTLVNTNGYLHFEYGGFDEERSHLPRSRDEKAELERDIVRELKEFNGLSYRDIADKLGTSLATVQRTAKSHGLARKPQKTGSENK